METIETPLFPSTASLIAWMKHAQKMDRYCKVATSVTTVFGDGTEWTAVIERKGKASTQPGTVAANFSFMISTLTGKMAHKSDNALGEEIDRRGGVRFIYEIAPE